jgi:CP family cyanate transporter-like MFS transporter
VVFEVMAATGLSASGASLVATVPVLCLGLFAAVAPALARRFGLERAVLLALGVMVVGMALRGGGGVFTLVAGGLVAGAGIGVINVLLPGLVKRDFADAAPLMTGFYSMALCAGAALAAGATAPLRGLFSGSWQLALAFWTLPVVVALAAACLAWRGRLSAPASLVTRLRSVSLLREPLAWQVTGFMGLQSMLAYSVFGWMAPILRARGDSAVLAGIVVSVSVLSQVVASLPAPLFAARMARQSEATILSMLAVVLGFAGLMLAPLWLQWGFAVLMGLGMGAAFALAILLIVLRSPDGAAAARLSSMAQCVGYSFASLGPLLIGVLHDRYGGWGGALALFVVVGAGGAVAGALAGRPRMVRG